MNDINRLKYKLNYDFGVFGSYVENFMSKLYGNSVEYLNKQIDRKEIYFEGTKDYHNPLLIQNIRHIKKFLRYVEDFLNYYYHVYSEDIFLQVFKSISELKYISVLPENDRGIFGITYPSSGLVLMNPVMSNSKTLSSDERIRLYVAHELGHMVNSTWANVYPLMNDYSVPSEKKNLMYDGFSLLDEATTQNRAEDIAYYYARKRRPDFAKYRDSRGMYDGKVFESNFDFYGELEQPALSFAKTLRGIGKLPSNQRCLDELSLRAITPEFAKNIFREYFKDKQFSNFISIMSMMGIFKNASYARFGYADKKYLGLSGRYYNEFFAKTKSLKDNRNVIEFS